MLFVSMLSQAAMKFEPPVIAGSGDPTASPGPEHFWFPEDGASITTGPFNLNRSIVVTNSRFTMDGGSQHPTRHKTETLMSVDYGKSYRHLWYDAPIAGTPVLHSRWVGRRVGAFFSQTFRITCAQYFTSQYASHTVDSPVHNSGLQLQIVSRPECALLPLHTGAHWLFDFALTSSSSSSVE